MTEVIMDTVPVRFVPHHAKCISSCKKCGRSKNNKQDKLGVATGRPTVLLRVPTDVKVKDMEVSLREVLPKMTPPSYSWFGLRKRRAKPYGPLHLMIKQKRVIPCHVYSTETNQEENELVPLPSDTVVTDLLAADTTAKMENTNGDGTQLELYYSEERAYGDDDCCLALCAMMACCCACCAAENAMERRQQQQQGPQNGYNPQYGYQNQQPPPGAMPPNNNYYSGQGNQYGVPPPPPPNAYPPGGAPGGGYPGQPMYYNQPPMGMQQQGLPPSQYGENMKYPGGPL